MERQTHTARLEAKRLLSAATQCFHLEFSIDGLGDFPFTPGQFISTVASDQNGKQQTRAYSLASAPHGNRFDLCLNRVENGFFSNLLCDLQPGQTVPFHGPHGMFTLRSPLTNSILITTDTGIAPMRGFLQHLFPAHQPGRTEGRHIHLIYSAEQATELYYHDEFQQIAAQHPNFHYLPTLTNPPQAWTGQRGTLENCVANVAADHAGDPSATDSFATHAYLCGLNEMVSTTRAQLKELRWQRKQIVHERYD